MKQLLGMSAAVLVGVVAFGSVALAETAATNTTPSQDVVVHEWKNLPDQQGDQLKLLTTLAGNWAITGQTYKGGPYGVGKFTAREHNEFMKGGQFLMSKTQYSSLFKNSSQVAFYGYDQEKQKYNYSLFSSTGVIVRATGELRDKAKTTLVGNALEWSDKEVEDVAMTNGKPTLAYETEVVSPNEYKFRLYADGVLWYDGDAVRENAVSMAR